MINSKECGTAFAIEYNSKQYLVTAKHLVKYSTNELNILRDNKWHKMDVKIVGIAEGEIDIIVFALPFQISPIYQCEPSLANAQLGQDVYILGFPYKIYGIADTINRKFPLPFVKKGILSCIFDSDDGIHRIYTDIYNNPGFSGGPMIFQDANTKLIKIGSVVSKFKIENEMVKDYKDEEKELYIQMNTGITITYGIKHAIDLISKNEIGFPVT